ncbi:Predicted arabinose efflux permease, MFS family [Paracoccus aminovorans]|uniref:Predicted arabinose efflux permease, MFS family n=1 Tax=Paracoccus aminovorans TaxID=34004 RepID=A0A1I3DSX8_9RHOB|nr:MFS transporter [Paracoccus aminovorans]CQR86948.1 major facilitator superfamily protein [Paracoccus aminovorans]SFH89816.1 Predicted arabinose efflux permease, MFS family [Paracoccus aminovorans]
MGLASSGSAPVAQQQKSSIRLLFAASMGTVIEWYDFAIFAFCAALVFNSAFFPEVDPVTGVIAALSAQAVGFVARPVGGWFFGVLGDRIGRKKALVLSLYLMGGATVAMGLLPTYAQIGILAPLLLLVLRLLQGFAIGGESTGALVLIAESLPAKQRGLWTGFPMVGGPAGNVLATGVIGAVIGYFGSDGFTEWGWRIPFLMSALLILLGIWVRRKVEESPAFINLQENKAEVVKAPLREALSTQGHNMLRVLLVKSGESALFYLFSTFFIVLATVFLKSPREDALNALFTASIVEVLVILAAGATADRIGRRTVTLVGLIGGILAGFWLFSLEPGASGADLTRATILTLTFHGIIVGGMSAYFTELFPARVRYTAMSTSYSAATVLGGALAPIIGTWLLNSFGTPFAVAVYAAMMAIPAIIVMFTTPETRGRDLVQ